MYDQYSQNIKFNFVIIDYACHLFTKEMNESINFQRTIYERTNKIYFLSDGFESYTNWRKYYINNYEKHGYVDVKAQNEKNVIWDQNIIKIFEQIVNTFNPNEYNFIFKSHPRIDETTYEARMEELFTNYYDNIVVLKPKYPLEFLVILDW